MGKGKSRHSSGESGKKMKTRRIERGERIRGGTRRENVGITRRGSYSAKHSRFCRAPSTRNSLGLRTSIEHGWLRHALSYLEPRVFSLEVGHKAWTGDTDNVRLPTDTNSVHARMDAVSSPAVGNVRVVRTRKYLRQNTIPYAEQHETKSLLPNHGGTPEVQSGVASTSFYVNASTSNRGEPGIP